MKTNTLNFVSHFCTSLLLAFILVLFGAMRTALAQPTVPALNQSDLNGLFTPTSAQRFFGEGRRNLEREAEILAHPERYSRGSLLQINTIDIQIIDESEEPTIIPHGNDNSPQQQLDGD